MKFSLLFRKSPAFRTLLYVSVIGAAVSVFSLVAVNSRRVPVIASLDPPVGSAGDILTISGENFGILRESSFVEIAGSRITSSGYIEWSDSLIKVVIPSNVQDGLVSVVTGEGRSKPGFFANSSGIPVVAPPDTSTSLPVVSSVLPSSAFIGSVVTITGTNFGSVRGSSSVVFTANRSGEASDSADSFSIPADERSFDYESWSDSEIKVRIPDGAASGNVFVRTEKGVSGTKRLDVKSAGTKKVFSGKTYVVKLDEDVDSIDSKNATNITLRVPRPVVSSFQPFVEMNECVPEPLIADFNNSVIHQIELQKSRQNQSYKQKFSQSFVVTTFCVETELNPRNVKAYDKERVLYRKSVAPDQLVESADSAVVEMARAIVGKESNPYLQARAVYDYMLANYTVLPGMRPSDSDPKELLSWKRGDAYDFAILYTAMLRSLGIPSLPVAGILVSPNESSESGVSVRNHWWSEFYIEGFGWIPVDVALGNGMEFDSFRAIPSNDVASYYFGSIDNQHVAFSRGWNEVKQSLVNGKIVYRPRTFAFQSIWEEAGEGSVNYSSLWNNPIVQGIY